VKSNGVPLTLTLLASGIWVASVGVYWLALIWIFWLYAEPAGEASPARLK